MTVQLQNAGSLLVMSNGNVTVQYNLTNGNAAFFWQNLEIVPSFYSGIGFTSGQGYIKGTNYTSWTYSILSSNEVEITAVGKSHPTMNQFFTFDQQNSFLVQVGAQGVNLSANWMGPMVVDYTSGVDIKSYGDDRALFVPFDNDDFVSYNAMSINSSDTGFEVAAFYDNVSRNGLVVGSVTHDTWKSGVYWNGSGNTFNQMNVFSGANSSTYTHDAFPHGSVYGNTILSAVMFIGYGPDWRTTLEDFADENTEHVPDLAWNNGVPFGWNSWGVIQESIDYSDATNASYFIAHNLQNSNFNNSGTVYVNLDSYWDNLSDSQVQQFVNYCHGNGQKAGLYLAPYAWFGTSNQALTRLVEGGTNYYYSQIILKGANGAYEQDGSGYALDPTHPGTQQRVNFYINEFTNWGIDFLKIDFLTHASLEGAHYLTNITTGIEAYNYGLQFIDNELNDTVFISESIAPLFPYQYGHSRRIACDAEGSAISNTEYTLNSVSYGWWLDRLYSFNDPDIMVFDGLTTNENQSRLISGAITGLFLNGDSFLSAGSDSAASSALTNATMDAIARFGKTFVAAEGNTGTAASMVFSSQQNGGNYLAVFNYSTNSSVTNVSLARAGISGVVEAVDLWSGKSIPVVTNSLTVPLNATQGRLFSLLSQPVLQAPQLNSFGELSFTLTGNPGYFYSLQSSTNLKTWNTVETVSNQTGSVQFYAGNPTGNAFYRAVLLP